IDNGSTLQVGNGGTTGSLGTGAVSDNGTLVFNRSDNIAVNNVISGSGGLTQSGSGTVTLGAANTYMGATTVANGTVQLGVASALPRGTSLTLGSATGNTSGALDLNGKDATVGALATAGTGANNIVTNSSNATTSTLTFAGGTSTFSGKIQDGAGKVA